MMKMTPRELEILELISKGYSTDNIARTLFISRNTVKTHRKTLMIKLDAANCAQMVRRGFEQGILVTQSKQYSHFSTLSIAS